MVVDVEEVVVVEAMVEEVAVVEAMVEEVKPTPTFLKTRVNLQEEEEAEVVEGPGEKDLR